MTSPSKAISTAMNLWLFILRQDMKLAQWNIKRLRRRNLESEDSIVSGRGGPVVSLTSFGERLKTVHLTIESIGLGTLLPSRLILWIQDEEAFNNRPDSLRRLEKRGLEVCLTESFGSHSKYFPYLLSTNSFLEPLATADDDMLYSGWWLAGLTTAHDQDYRLINCYRAHFMQFANGAIKPYLRWETRKSTEPSARCFATGSAGVIYPAEFQVELKRAGRRFLDLCPRADDVWLHVNALRAGFKIRQITNKPLDFPSIPETQKTGLFQANWNLGGNDEQIRNTYTAEDIARLMTEEPVTAHPVMQYTS